MSVPNSNPVVAQNTGFGPVAEPGVAMPSNADHSEPPALKDTPEPLSKSARKKAAKAERYAIIKLERRAREKEAKKEKKRQRAEKRAAGELDVDEDEINRRKKRPKASNDVQFHGRIIVDLGFDEMMSEKEIVSLCSQLAYTYSANRRASFPFSLVYSSLNGRTFDRLESMSDASYKRWAHTTWWQEGYEQIWLSRNKVVPPSPHDTSAASTSDTAARTISSAEGRESVLEGDAKDAVVYLTADSEVELAELKENEVYIIGGICDHNRYKNLCLNKARESGIRTARLPIGRYLASLPTRKVLTVNQVFEILLKWVETRDWEAAFHSVIPKRKFQTGGNGKPSTGNEGIDTVDQDGDEAQGSAKG